MPSGRIPSWIGKMASLEEIDLSGAPLGGEHQCAQGSVHGSKHSVAGVTGYTYEVKMVSMDDRRAKTPSLLERDRGEFCYQVTYTTAGSLAS